MLLGESALALFHSPQPLPDDAVPTILINDLARLNGDLVLILTSTAALRRLPARRIGLLPTDR
jgi:hypothetical protein